MEGQDLSCEVRGWLQRRNSTSRMRKISRATEHFISSMRRLGAKVNTAQCTAHGWDALLHLVDGTAVVCVELMMSCPNLSHPDRNAARACEEAHCC
eukprot:166496-Rhodomonas_salina.4